ncbi:LysR family transcriptional regulator [Grimontia sp. NTOU-MAR1]|uniref:LysR family transcriptional regulator n=1 Tax=Grimontia sp. NTOU-MAR1 TaxID=3111011 RepID=UPI002DB5A99E|nr:LysR family transcriptional regulator [Grimontia sp. NTOU-MAR1]WRV99047.1 LysR family transcriptional regulator [Grimontia sp. NTOU-MAR1]
MTLPPLYALRAFEVAARLGSFSQAAEVLNVTPSAISRHVRTLEEWFECKLFERHGPKVIITPAGKSLASQLTKSFQSLENACSHFGRKNRQLRLKAPSTLAISWLLDVLSHFRDKFSVPAIEIVSVWMDVDNVDFVREPYDCAILLGQGNFGADTECLPLFEELLIPVCSPALLSEAQHDLSACELIHPTSDRRDWRRWIDRTGDYKSLNINKGKVFDTLEQGNQAAISRHGISVGDLLLSLKAIESELLVLPFKQAVVTGDSYYLVWPKGCAKEKYIDLLYQWLKSSVPGPLPDDVARLN